jgi:hypothetical protein
MENQKMTKEHVEVNLDSADEVGQNARRMFLKKSGRVVVAAPAAILLLAAANKSAHAQTAPYTAVDDTLDFAGPPGGLP